MKKLLFLLIVLFFFSTLVTAQQDTTNQQCLTTDMDTTEFVQLPWFDNNQFLEDFYIYITLYHTAKNSIYEKNTSYTHLLLNY